MISLACDSSGAALPAKILTRGAQFAFGMRADRVVERDRLDDVEQLALVFVDALDLDVEQRVRIDARRRAGRG